MKFLWLSSLMFLAVACLTTEQYQLRYSFADQLGGTAVTATADGAHLEFPFASISCQADQLQAVLVKREQIFTITISGPETAERCSRQFRADLLSVKPGSYQLELIYSSPAGDQKVLAQEFIVL